MRLNFSFLIWFLRFDICSKGLAAFGKHWVGKTSCHKIIGGGGLGPFKAAQFHRNAILWFIYWNGQSFRTLLTNTRMFSFTSSWTQQSVKLASCLRKDSPKLWTCKTSIHFRLVIYWMCPLQLENWAWHSIPFRLGIC